MAGFQSFIIIPGGVKTKKHIELGRYYLLYTCPYCGREALSEQVLERTNRRSFTGLKEQSAPEADTAAKTPRELTDPERERAFRERESELAAGNCSSLEKPVRCPRCGKKQLWSGMGKPWLRSVLPLLAGIGFFIGVYSLRLLYGDPATRAYYPLTWIPLGVVLLLSLGYVLRRRRRLAAAKKLGESLEFYGPDRLRELREGPHGRLLKPYER